MHRCVLHRAVHPTLSAPRLALEPYLSAPAAGALFFANRAVKSTCEHPQFVCLPNALVCQSPRSSAAIVLSAEGGEGCAGLPMRARVHLDGACAVGVYRNQRIALQCLGDGATQTHELQLRPNDLFVVLSGVSRDVDIAGLFRATADGLRTHGTDVEYVAEDLILSLPSSATRCSHGFTSVVAEVRTASTPGMPEPPASSFLL